MSLLPEVLGQSPPMTALRESAGRLLARLAPSQPSTVLILGETGAGKGLLAQALHRGGPRASGPFVDVNCAAIPEALLESELFGYERGAFTDARQPKVGLVQAAHRGTLFLDEIGSLPGPLQGKLLKVLEERVVRRLGSTRAEAVDVWVVAATNEDLEAAVAGRRFRRDLYHRLAVLTLRVPPLRQRGQDVLLLARHLLAAACADAGTPPKSLSPEACALLMSHAWPGNVRELGNVMRRVAMLSIAEVVPAQDIELGSPSRARRRQAATPEPVSAEETALDEAGRLRAVLARTGWNLSRAAAALGMPRNTLRYRMARHGLAAEPPVAPAPGPAGPPPLPEPVGPPKVAPPGAAPAGAGRHNLPEQLTSFVGRTGEMAELRKALAGSRLLTLTGAGGSGKTRLALEVASALRPEFPDGVWLVELATLTQPAMVPRAVASVLGIQEEVGQPLADALVDVLRSRRTLVVLDNCEHLLLACAHLAQRLLQAAGHLRILATSLQPLGVGGEVVFIVPPLSLGPPTRSASVGEVAGSDAVRLFVDRAHTVHPDFALTDENAGVVAEVCRRLDGIPLALELAAARIKHLTVEQIQARLDDRFRLLSGGSRVALPRQQTLRAAMDWSYDLLSDPERLLLERLSVFAGGFGLEAAEFVCAGRGLPESEILDLLSQLVDKSLAISEVQATESRYRLLETIREYAREKGPASAEELAELRTRHHAWYLKLAEQAEAGFRGVDQTLWLDRLEADHDNLRAALSWLEAGVDRRLRLAAALWRFWEVRGRQREGRTWLEGVLADSASAPALLRARALNGVGNLARDQGDYQASAAHHREALALRQAHDDRRGIAVSLNNLGAVAHDQGDYEAARALYTRAMPLWREAGDAFGVALTLNNLGRAWRFQGDYGRAAELGLESLRAFQALGHPWGIARALNSQADLAHYQGDLGRAATLYGESLEIRRRVDDKLGIAVSLNSLGLLALREGDLSRAARLAEEGLGLRRDLGDPRGLAVSLNTLGVVALSRGELEPAAALCRESLALRRHMGDRIGIARCLEALALLAVAAGDGATAARRLGAAQAVREAIGAPLPPVDRPTHDRLVVVLEAALDPVVFREAWTEGTRGRPGQAEEDALGEAPSTARPGSALAPGQS